MKNIILAAATVLALGAASTSAYAEGEGPFYTGEQWAAQNGNPQVPATAYFAQGQLRVQQQASARPTPVVQSGNGQG